MILFLVSILFLLLHIIFYNSVKINRILIVLFFLFVCSAYTILAMNSYHSISFLPKKNIELYFHTGNFYNWLMTSFLNFKLNLDVDMNFVNYLSNLPVDYLSSNQQLLPMDIKMSYDTSIYNNKMYLYFGITPIILFYAPFYLITRLFLSDQIVFLFCSICIFVLQLLIFKRILFALIKNKILNGTINKYFNVACLLILSFCNGIPLMYVAITVHSITILTSILCQLITLYLFLLLFNNKFVNLKMFFIGLFLALAVGARPASIFLLILIFVLLLYNFNIKKYWKQYLCFIIPVIFYGTLLAIYNYLRFDSIFDFGYTHQFGPIYQKGVAQNLNHSFIDFIKHIYLNLFHLPIFTSMNPLCVFKNCNSVSYFEPMIGGIIVCPIIISLIFIKNFIMKIFNTNKYICLLFTAMLSTSLIYFLINSYIGSNARFVAEYLFLFLVPSLVLYNHLIENIKNKKLANIINLLFFCLVIFSLYVNINLINCIFLMSKEGLI